MSEAHPLIGRLLRSVRVELVPTVPPELGPCWVWTRTIDEKGYGRLTINRVQFKAHRLTVKILAGKNIDRLVVDHLCRNRACVNPEHLDPVDSRTNTLRGESPAAKRARQSHCLRGHELAGANLYTHPKRGTRECRACKKERRK